MDRPVVMSLTFAVTHLTGINKEVDEITLTQIILIHEPSN